MRYLFTLLLIILSSNVSIGQLDSLVQQIIEGEQVNYSYVGRGGWTSKQYQLYEKLSSNSSIDELLKLVQHENNVVKSYAAWSLIDKDYKKLDDVFKYFLDNDEKVLTYRGCIVSRNLMSSIFYYKYLNEIENKVEDELLIKLDSIIFYTENVSGLLIYRALENRIHPRVLHPRIEYLAFKELNNHALFYLATWYKAEYYLQLKEALTTFLNEAEYKKVGTSSYYETVKHLLDFGDSKIEKIVINKLKKDEHWRMNEKKFMYLLEEHGIYESYLKD